MAQINLFRTHDGRWKAIVVASEGEFFPESFTQAVADLLRRDDDTVMVLEGGGYDVRVLA